MNISEAFEGLLGDERYKVMFGGRGSAKSWTVADILTVIKGTERPRRILCCREVQKSIRDSVHALLRDRIRHHGLDEYGNGFYRITDRGIRGRNGTEFIYAGLKHNPEGVKSTEGIDIAWVEEAETVSDKSLDILTPTVRKPGSQIWLTFNPRYKTDAVWQRFVKRPPPDGRAWIQKVTFEDNPWFPDVLRAEMEDDKATDYEKYLHKWLGELQSYAEGSIYAVQIKRAREEGRILPRIPVVTTTPVHTAWDLGRNDHTAIWFFQHVGPMIRLVDYYQNRMQEPEHYWQVLQGRGYNYGEHLLPHDGGHVKMGMGNRSLIQQFRELGMKNVRRVPRTPEVIVGINRTRQLWSVLQIAEEQCEDGMDCLIEYAFKYDDLRGTHLMQPLHNWASNGADALRMIAEGYDWNAPAPEISDRRKRVIREKLGSKTDAHIV
ncbi:MAG: PBSX family phage terminase large subunit [Pseudomonadales bacterium]|nr:PBSX family phage terminase large subunit [Pseudomonadales bacterium]